MKKHKIAIFLICIIMIINLTGCQGSHELNELAYVLGMGIDKVKDSEKVLVTAQIANVSQVNTSRRQVTNANESSFVNLESTADTVFYAIRDFNHSLSRELFLPHNQVLIIGNELAKEGIEEYIDFFVRDHSTRLNIFVLVAKDQASEIFNATPEFENVPSYDIARILKEDQHETSEVYAITLKDVCERLMSKTTSPIIPIIELKTVEDKKRAYIANMAVFKKDKLVDVFDEAKSRGVLWVIGEVNTGIVVVDCPTSSGKVSLEVTSASSKVSMEVKDNTINANIEINVTSNLGEQSTSDDLTSLENVALLEQAQVAVIETEILSAIKRAQKLKTDIFGFGDILHQRNLKKFNEFADSWDEVFPAINVTVKVHATLYTSDRITKPVSYKEE